MKKATYFSESVAAIVSPKEVESWSGRVGFLIASADQAAKEACPELALNEWLALVDACNGSLAPYEHGPDSVVNGVCHNVFDLAEEGDEKWEVSCHELARTLNAMPFAAKLAVFEVVRRFWLTPALEGENYRQMLTRVGAKIKPAE